MIEPGYPERRPISATDMKQPMMPPMDYDDIIPMNPSVRDPEYLSHPNLLLGSILSQYMPGMSKTEQRFSYFSKVILIEKSKLDFLIP